MHVLCTFCDMKIIQCMMPVYCHVLLQHWIKLTKSGGGPWPEERSSHAACCLNYGQQFPQLLVTGGVDRQEQATIRCLDS